MAEEEKEASSECECGIELWVGLFHSVAFCACHHPVAKDTFSSLDWLASSYKQKQQSKTCSDLSLRGIFESYRQFFIPIGDINRLWCSMNSDIIKGMYCFSFIFKAFRMKIAGFFFIESTADFLNMPSITKHFC